METTHKNFIILINGFLDDKYYLKENRFFTKYNNIHEWGFQIAELIEGTFSISRESSKEILKNWASDKYLSKKNFDSAWGSKKLAAYTKEELQDLQAYFGITSTEEQLIKTLSEELTREIDNRIISDLRNEITCKVEKY